MTLVLRHFILIALLVLRGLFIPNLALLVREGLEAFGDETGNIPTNVDKIKEIVAWSVRLQDRAVVLYSPLAQGRNTYKEASGFSSLIRARLALLNFVWETRNSRV